MHIYWSRHQAETRRNIFRRRLAEEGGVGMVACVAAGEDDEKEGMEKWMLIRVQEAVVGLLYGHFA